MRVVVLGATGNIGTQVVTVLGRDEHVDTVVGVARRVPPPGTLGIEWRSVDVATDDLTAVLAGADAVVDLVWALQPSWDLDALHRINIAGTRRVLDAVATAGSAQLVYASSIGAYSPAPAGTFATEEWPTDGVATSTYSRQKAYVERMLDHFEAAHPSVRVVRLRPSLVFQRSAAGEIHRLFLGPLVPRVLLDPKWIPAIPVISGLAFQAVHAEDVAQAVRLALHAAASGAFNLAGDDVVDTKMLARRLRARPVPLPPRLLRSLAAITWRLHLQPSEPGWLDMALHLPLLDTSRARTELGWHPTHSSSDTVMELIDGLRTNEPAPTPALGRPAPP